MGEKVYVRLEKKGLKLGRRVCEGCWLGVDEESKGVQIYWPDTKLINVERNVYYNDTSASCNEEEQHDTIMTSSNLPTKISKVKPPAIQEEISEAENPTAHIQKPTKCVQHLLEGNTTWTNKSKAQKVFPGVQLPTNIPENDELALTAKTTNSEALEP